MDLKESVKNWLIKEKMFKEKVDDPSANFHYIIEFPQNNINRCNSAKGKSRCDNYRLCNTGRSRTYRTYEKLNK